jgi:hydroxymethylbilane synthase
MQRLRIATRGSELALWQANFVATALAKHQIESQLLIVETQGDRELLAFRQLSGTGFFTKAVQAAVLAGEADLAVHSLKDLPSATVAGLRIAAIPVRADAREALLLRPEAVDRQQQPLAVRPNARIGTSAIRRQAQIAQLRPDLRVLELRGNVPTRVARLRQGHYDAIILAWAGLLRLDLDLSDLVLSILPVTDFVPAPGQGALALECRSDDQQTFAVLRQLNDPATQASVELERSLMARLDGGCQLALGAYAVGQPTATQLLAWYNNKSYLGDGIDAVYRQMIKTDD